MAKEKIEKVVKTTLEGKEKMEAELLELRTVKRKEIAEKIKVARSYGDLSENSEYDEAKNEQAMIEAKIAELEQTLKIAVIVDDNLGMASDKIRHGSVVKLLFVDSGEEKTVEVVNSYDVTSSDVENREIQMVSEDSPIGLHIVGRKASDEIIAVEAPVGIINIKILEIVK